VELGRRKKFREKGTVRERKGEELMEKAEKSRGVKRRRTTCLSPANSSPLIKHSEVDRGIKDTLQKPERVRCKHQRWVCTWLGGGGGRGGGSRVEVALFGKILAISSYHRVEGMKGKGRRDSLPRRRLERTCTVLHMLSFLRFNKRKACAAGWQREKKTRTGKKKRSLAGGNIGRSRKAAEK